MKKIIMAAAIVCVASFVHAAACEWSLAGITKSETTDVAAGSMIAYFMDGSTYDSFKALTSGQGDFVTAKGLSNAKISVGRTGATAGASFGSFNPGDVVSGYIVIFDSSDVANANYYAATALDSKDVPGAGNAKFAKTFAQTAGWQALSTTPGPVPEPTSGLLLVLGGAALALRRRR